MRKQIRTLIIVMVSVLLLVGMLLALLYLIPDTTEETTSSSDTTSSDTSVTLIEKGSSVTVTKAVIKTADEEYEISANSDSVLAVTTYADLPIETDEIETLTDDLVDLTADRMVADNSDKAADFGLDAPQATVVVTYSDNSTVTIELGDETPLATGYYARISGDNSIYIVDSTFGETLLQGSTTYISTSVIEAPEVNDDDDNGEAVLRSMTLSGTVRASKPFTFRLYSEDADSSDLSSFTYISTSPSVLGISDDDAEDIISATSLTASEAVKAHPTDEDLATYGLADPYSKCEMTLAVQTTTDDTDGDDEDEISFYNVTEHTIILGNTNDDGDYYAMIDDYDVVYLVSSSSVPWAETQLNDICTKFLFMNNITTVDSIALTNSGTTTTFDLTHYPDESDSDAKLAVTVDGTTYPTDSFRDLYQVFMSVNRYGDSTESPSGDPEITFQIKFVDTTKSDFVAKFYKLTSSTYLCVVENGETYTVKSSSLKNLLTQVNNYLDGKSVSTG